MLQFTPYTVDKEAIINPHIRVSNILEPIDESIIFSYHLGEFPGSDQGIMLTLYYFDVDSLGELLYINFMRLPKWLIRYIKEGNSIEIVDELKNICIDLHPQKMNHA